MSDEENKQTSEATPVAEPTTEPEKTPEVAAEVTTAEAIQEQETAKHEGQTINAADLRPGMTIRLHERIKDVSPKGEVRERIQVFQGIVTGVRGAAGSKTMTIRRVQKGYGVEKIFPLKSPIIAKMELVKSAKVRRAKLSFLGDLRHPFKRKMKETWVDTKA